MKRMKVYNQDQKIKSMTFEFIWMYVDELFFN